MERTGNPKGYILKVLKSLNSLEIFRFLWEEQEIHKGIKVLKFLNSLAILDFYGKNRKSGRVLKV
jgi:hypothetical protein